MLEEVAHVARLGCKIRMQMEGEGGGGEGRSEWVQRSNIIIYRLVFLGGFPNVIMKNLWHKYVT